MGELLRYSCRHCGYKSTVTEGAGTAASFDTQLCTDCQEIVSVPVWINPEMRELPYKNLNVCPICQGKNLHPLEGERTCPKCGNEMKTASLGIWD